MKAYMTFQHGSQPLGTLYMELEQKVVPKTVRNFEAFLRKGYKGTNVHRLIKGFMLQAGDITAGDGTGGYSIYGKTFADENFILRHDRPGRLSMANAGPNTNGSQFFITFKPTPHLDGKHVVFGSVDLQRSGTLLKTLEQIKTLSNDKPKQELTIVDCGIIEEAPDSAKTAAVAEAVDADADEIDLEEEEEEEEDVEARNDVVQEVVESEDDDSKPLSKSEALKRRLRKLKQKVNQARQLNRQAVKDEGERSTVEGSASARKKLAAANKEGKNSTWAQQNAKALSIANESGVDAKHLTEQAADSVYKARLAAERAETQPHKYLRDLKSIPRNLPQSSETGISTFNPLQNEVNPDKEREGARRLALEMHKRVEKNTKRLLSVKRKGGDDGDVSYINKRNKIFNEKISRDYDKHTAEIRESLERGSAL
jgi:cyclophilin family peptidyl-prolyl cis-trans isomerase